MTLRNLSKRMCYIKRIFETNKLIGRNIFCKTNNIILKEYAADMRKF